MARPYRFETRVRDNPFLQVPTMTRTFPQFRYAPVGSGALRWNGTLQPTEDSTVYEIEIRHQVWRAPQVWVRTPVLVEKPPHVYAASGNSLCLYYPQDWQWTPRQRLAETIVPWAALWLYYYEAWLVTGLWLGPSSPHAVGDKKDEVA